MVIKFTHQSSTKASFMTSCGQDHSCCPVVLAVNVVMCPRKALYLQEMFASSVRAWRFIALFLFMNLNKFQQLEKSSSCTSLKHIFVMLSTYFISLSFFSGKNTITNSYWGG